MIHQKLQRTLQKKPSKQWVVKNIQGQAQFPTIHFVEMALVLNDSWKVFFCYYISAVKIMNWVHPIHKKMFSLENNLTFAKHHAANCANRPREKILISISTHLQGILHTYKVAIKVAHAHKLCKHFPREDHYFCCCSLPQRGPFFCIAVVTP